MNGRRSAMTIVELLVVTGLLVSLLGLIVVGMRVDPAVDPRQAAREFASVLLAGQSRALGKPEGAAVMVAAADDGRIGSIVQEARSLPLIMAAVEGMPPNPGSASAAVQIQADVTGGYKVRFQAAVPGMGSLEVSPWYRLQPPGTVTFRSGAGQTADNTVWPKQRGGMQAVVARWPMPGATPLTLAKQVAIDLRHSGVGDDPAALRGFGRLEGKGPVAIAFDEVGRVTDVMQQVGNTTGAPVEPLVPTQPIYFLFVSRDDIVAGRNTLANDKAVWVAIHPLSGRVTVAANVPQQGQDTAALQAARDNVRRGMIAK